MPRRPSPDLTIGQRIRVRRLTRGWSMRFAASRAGISHATWSRIERGVQAADNRFIVADIAAALECSPADLTGTVVPTGNRDAAAAQASLYAIRQALIDTDLGDPPTRQARPVQELDNTVTLIRRQWLTCEYTAAGQLLPEALRNTHAATAGPDRYQALVLFHETAAVASTVMRVLGHPAEAWLSAERCRSAAEATEDLALLGNAAMKRALAAASCGSFSRALAIAERAIDAHSGHQDRSSALEAYGILHLVCAGACRALKRDDDSASWMTAAIDLARRTGETTTLGLHFGPTNVNFWRVGIEADGGDPALAITIAGQTTTSVLDVPDRLVAFYADLARACSHLPNRQHDAVRYLLTAERTAPQHIRASAYAQETARALLARAQRSAGGPALRGLCERLGLTT